MNLKILQQNLKIQTVRPTGPLISLCVASKLSEFAATGVAAVAVNIDLCTAVGVDAVMMIGFVAVVLLEMFVLVKEAVFVVTTAKGIALLELFVTFVMADATDKLLRLVLNSKIAKPSIISSSKTGERGNLRRTGGGGLGGALSRGSNNVDDDDVDRRSSSMLARAAAAAAAAACAEAATMESSVSESKSLALGPGACKCVGSVEELLFPTFPPNDCRVIEPCTDKMEALLVFVGKPPEPLMPPLAPDVCWANCGEGGGRCSCSALPLLAPTEPAALAIC
uniref:Uncharacterized protein n=1 Tax=Glossina palpalis gambiensis TaxID=67801 RepID=A0A1B0B015_9MUSC